MANPNPVDGAAARLPADFNDDEPMEADPRVAALVTAAQPPTIYSEPSVGNQERFQRKEICNTLENSS